MQYKLSYIKPSYARYITNIASIFINKKEKTSYIHFSGITIGMSLLITCALQRTEVQKSIIRFNFYGFSSRLVLD